MFIAQRRKSHFIVNDYGALNVECTFVLGELYVLLLVRIHLLNVSYKVLYSLGWCSGYSNHLGHRFKSRAEAGSTNWVGELKARC